MVCKALEGAARGIAANKRTLLDDDPAVDRCWRSYVGQAQAALNGSGLFQIALPYIDSMAEAQSMMDGFGPRHACQADVDARTVRIALGFDLPPLRVGDLMRPGMADEDWRGMRGKANGT